MNITFEIKNNTLITGLRGELDHHCASVVREQIENKYKSEGLKNLIFDMTGVTFMDSSGIGVIMGRYRNIASVGGTVCIVGIKGHAKKIYDMSGLATIIKYYQSTDEALMKI